jgi:hypothetical protein
VRPVAMAAASIALISAGPVGEDSGLAALRRALEMPAHRALVAVISAPNTTLTPFATDGCSGGLSTTWSVVADIFPNFVAAHEGRPPWEICCIAHDRRYHDAGGATEAVASYDARLAADEELRACVLQEGEQRITRLARHYNVSEGRVRLAYGAIADGMYNSVRFGGAPCSGLSWRWGYGFPRCVEARP